MRMLYWILKKDNMVTVKGRTNLGLLYLRFMAVHVTVGPELLF